MSKTISRDCMSSMLCKIALAALLLFPGMNVLQAGQLSAKIVTGTVTGASDNEPLIGASVTVQGKTLGSLTDIDGNFKIEAEDGQTLVVSYIGYVTQKVKVSGSVMNIVLKEDAQSLDDVVVIGYGVQKKKLVTGATVQLKGDEIAQKNTTNPLQAMQGSTPGVNIVSTSGQPGAGISVTIRGLGTVGNSQPLYLIDGIAGDITTLNPADIESIDVLKDAASAAIYGAQAANGVVLVTTKSGKEGSCKVTYDGFIGWQTLGRKFDVLNASEYMSIIDESRLNSGMSPVDWASLMSIRDTDGNLYDTDWLDEMTNNGALTTSHSLAFTGGSKTSTYVISGGYTGQDGLMGGSDVAYYKRYNLRANSEHKMWDGLLTVGERVSFVYKDTRDGGMTGNYANNNLRSAFRTSPLAPVYDADGNYNSTADSDWNTSDGNPYGVMMVNRYNQSKSGTLDANVYAQLEPIKNLKLKTVFGISYGASDYRWYRGPYQFTNDNASTITEVRQSNYDGLSLVWTNTLAYDFTAFGDHKFNALLGSETSSFDGVTTSGYNTGIITGFNDWEHAYLANTGGTASTSVKDSKPSTSTRGQSFFARLGWSWQDKYMINATLRADGSSKFAKGHRWGYFPSVSAGWTLSEEKFMEKSRSWLDFLKVRFSWGQVGNANIAAYQYLAPVQTSYTNYNFGTGGGQDAWITGAYTSRLANENVKWETSEQYNVGIDARFLQQRLSLTFDAYIKNTKDWLVQAPILATAGADGPIINGGDVKNKGIELGLTWNDNIGKDFSYNVGANFSYNHNEVGSIPTDDGIIHGKSSEIYNNADEYYRAENGHAIGYFWGYRTAGIFQNQQEIDNWVAAGNGILQANVQPGDVKYVDMNHDGQINADDKVDLGNGLPKYTFGFNLGFNWKGLDFSANFSGAAGFQIAQSYRNPDDSQANYSRSILSRWTGEGTSNKMPRVTYGDAGNWEFSDLYLQDGDYLRLQTLTVGYDFKRFVAWKGISKLRLYFQAQNLFTWTKYDGMDPEVGSYNGTSSDTAYTWVSGVDLGYYPHPRTFIVGVNVAF